MPSTDIIKTTDHEEIKRWAAAREGVPAVVDQAEEGYNSDPLRIYFERQSTENLFSLKPIDWKTFFTIMDNRRLAFAYRPGGDNEYYYEFVPREV